MGSRLTLLWAGKTEVLYGSTFFEWSPGHLNYNLSVRIYPFSKYKGLLLVAQFKVEISPAEKSGVESSLLRGPPSVQRVTESPLQQSFDLTSSVQ